VQSSHHLSFSHLHYTDGSTPEFYTLSLHDALPIFNPGGSSLLKSQQEETERLLCEEWKGKGLSLPPPRFGTLTGTGILDSYIGRSEEHTSELQSRENLVCRLLLEKKNNNNHE